VGDREVALAVGFDRFGNVTLDLEHDELTESGLKLGRPVEIAGTEGTFVTTFADVPPGELLLYEDAYRTLSVAVNRGSARELLGVEVDDEIRLRPLT
jgi:S-adenosyl-L-methionine hydrolase (adenosine-forming)